MSKKYAVYCLQRHQYYGAEHLIEDTEHFNSLNDVKEMLLDYHNDIDESDKKLLKKADAYEIAEMFQWEIQEVNR